MDDFEQDETLSRRPQTQKMSGRVSDKMGDLWWTFLLRGILALFLGILALFWPTGSVSMLLRIFGLFLLIDAGLTFFGAVRRDGDMQDKAGGLVTAIIGFILLVLPAASAGLAFSLLGLWAAVTGIGYLLTWRKLSAQDSQKDTTRNVGLFALAGGLILVFWPSTGLVAIAWVLALLAFVVAAVMLFLASRFKRLGARLQTPRK